MVSCELCGKETNSLTSIKVAGSTVRACSSCRHLGKRVQEQGPQSHTFKKTKKTYAPTQEVVSNYAQAIQQGLSKKNINTHNLAKTLNIKESSLQKYLTSKVKPDLEVAKKIQTFLEITLIVEQNEPSPDAYFLEEKASDDEPTLADLIKK